MEQKRKKVIILGTSESLQDTQWNLPDYDYWSVYGVLTFPGIDSKRIDKVFEMHEDKTWKKFKSRINEYVTQSTFKTEVIMRQKTKEIKNCVEYPLAEVQAMLGNNRGSKRLARYFTSSIAYIIAMAIYYEYEEIKLMGVAMAVDEEEYSRQRACCEAWLCYGMGKGINVVLPNESAVIKSEYLYGYEQQKDVIIKLIQMKQGLKEGLPELEKALALAKENRDRTEGAITGFEKAIQMFKS